MKKLLIIPFIFALLGCPGDNLLSIHRSVFMHGNVICFSLNKNDVLNYYTIDTVQGGEYKIVTYKEKIHLSYPDTCINVKLTNGYKYDIYYGLNGEKYSDHFFIDNDGNH